MAIRFEEGASRTAATTLNSLGHRDPVPVVVAYDIANDQPRDRLHRLLRAFGEPVQKSVFLCQHRRYWSPAR